MGVITGGNDNSFKTADYIYGRVRRLLKSFDAANLIDEGEFPTYTKDVLKLLKAGAYMETQALVPVKNKRAKLPDNFEYLYVAYKCNPIDNVKATRKHIQPGGFAFVTEVESAIVESYNDCVIDCCEEQHKVVNRIQVQHYVLEQKSDYREFGNVKPLQLSPNVKDSYCLDGHHNMLNNSAYEITIDNGYIYTNFDDNDYIYLKYYSLPMDEEGNLLVPNEESTEQAIMWYIVYQILLSNWFNGSIPDIQNKWQKAEAEYEKAFATAKYHNKLTSFADTINYMRTKRGTNKMVYFTGATGNTNFQRTR
jgi:hypothetical protein